ncbi:hypothetical protein BpHYR1_045576 [Brachionus plicatilis]|uniref:Uncharacterized protein n=1 Tax=Brachionus plicatilis TaxID=10195 RepID=A0A3M7QMW8_BRAPC|nr:hypothetical protein BpHYR1_045576 [Brachionus plicatilis]
MVSKSNHQFLDSVHSRYMNKLDLNNGQIEIDCRNFYLAKDVLKSFFQGSSEWQSLLFSPHGCNMIKFYINKLGVLMIESKGVLYFKLFLEEF